MPELPEVETLRGDLEREIAGRKVKAVTVAAPRAVRRHRTRRDFAGYLTGRKIVAVERDGTRLRLPLDDGSALWIDLGGRGQLRRRRTAAPAVAGTDAVISFAVGGDLRVLDLLVGGGELFVEPKGAEPEAPVSPPPIDPLSGVFTWPLFHLRLQARDQRLRPLLTGGELVTGVGPLYADEILWVSGLRGDRRPATLSAQEVRRLHRAILEVLHEAVRLRGTSVGEAPFLDLHGEPGGYQARLAVVGRTGRPCRRCRTPLVQEDVDGETTYYCPRCQS